MDFQDQRYCSKIKPINIEVILRFIVATSTLRSPTQGKLAVELGLTSPPCVR